VLFAWTRPAWKRLTVVPAPLVVVLLGVLLGRLLPALSPSLALRGDQLVTLPVMSSASALARYITLPDFSAFSNPKVYLVALTLAVIASLETLLSVEAADKLDPFKRSAATNRELTAQGVSNIFSGLLGGLPITAVIVRSAANVSAGARTRTAAFVHSVLLLGAAALIPSALNMIPLAALAGILIFTGWKLASPAVWKGMFKAGWDQFIPFVVTVLAILATDLLKGIGIGMAVGVFYVLRANYKLPYFFHKEHHPRGEKIRIVLSEHVSFLNKASILLTLRGLPADSVVEIDGTNSQVIDHDVLEIIHDFIEGAPARNIEVDVKGIQSTARTVGAH
jgi:MFS superfamily sulfate permease-like transporter